MTAVLFVCTGNICRSPTAEGVFRHLVSEAGLAQEVRTDSCGTHGYHVGDPPDSRAIATAAVRGIDLSDLRARKLAVGDFDRFDLLLAMDRGHLAAMEAMAPPATRGQTHLFLDVLPGGGGRDVPDPYYGDQGAFEHALDLIEEASALWLDRVRAGL